MTGQRAMTLRLAPNVYRTISDAAAAAGVPLSVYIREAALVRAAYEIGVTAGVGRIGEPDAAVIEPVREAVLQATREFLETGQ